MAKTVPDITHRVDRKLAEIDAAIDWLTYLSPIKNDAMWQNFVEGEYKTSPKLEYVDIPANYAKLKDELMALPIDDVEIPAMRVLLKEKQQELVFQNDLVLSRDKEAFSAISIQLFGGIDAALTACAENVLSNQAALEKEKSNLTQHYANSQDIAEAAHEAVRFYRKSCSDFSPKVEIVKDLNSSMMVSHGNFLIAESVLVPEEPVDALVAHEVGVHTVTRYNGRQQPFSLFEIGLAHYDPLQEGLGVLAEYLTGNLPLNRLKIIAARVLASNMALKHLDIKTIFESLHEDYGLPLEDAFDTAVRACRGGGLTKDAVYLRGLRDLLAFLANGGDIELLHLGKFSMGQLAVVEELLQQGWLTRPALIPKHISGPQSHHNIAVAVATPIEKLYH